MATGEHAFGRPARRRLSASSPPLSPSAGPVVAERDRGLPAGPPDPEAAAPGLRRLRAGGRRWTFALLAAAALVGGFFAVQNAQDRAADLLLRTGVHSDGTVLAVRQPRTWTYIEVGYVIGGVRKRVWINKTSDRRYAVGDHVLVATDPGRPARVRTAEEPNEDRATASVGIWMLIAGVVLVPVAVLRRISWARRLAAARRTGWYPAEVTIAPHRRLTAADHRPPDLRISYRDGPTIEARAAHAYGVAQLADRPRREVRVAGTGEQLALLFPAGVKGKRPYLVPAKAVTGR